MAVYIKTYYCIACGCVGDHFRYICPECTGMQIFGVPEHIPQEQHKKYTKEKIKMHREEKVERKRKERVRTFLEKDESLQRSEAR